MAREIVVLWAGRHQRSSWEELCRDYRRRIRRWTPIRDRWIRAAGDDVTRRRAETRAFLDALPDPSWTVALDPRGKPLTSRAFAAELGRLEEEWPHPIVFVIGSDLGLGDEVCAAARRRLSFGPMLFGHELARLVLYEQIYRALAMERGIKYTR